MHQADRQRIDARITQLLQLSPECGVIQGSQNVATRSDSFLGLHGLRNHRFAFSNRQIE